MVARAHVRERAEEEQRGPICCDSRGLIPEYRIEYQASVDSLLLISPLVFVAFTGVPLLR